MKSFYSGIYWKISSIRRKLMNQERLGIPETEESNTGEEQEFFRTEAWQILKTTRLYRHRTKGSRRVLSKIKEGRILPNSCYKATITMITKGHHKKRKSRYIWRVESLRCSPETFILVISYTSIQNKKFKINK